LKYDRVFVLGDSRTGTDSMHRYLASMGYKSIHLYEREAKTLPHTNENYEKNCGLIVDFVNESGFNAFSDYPTRLYYPTLYHAFPESAFILTVRKSTEVWVQSMEAYMSALGQEIDMLTLRDAYERVNFEIRSFFASSDRFLELVVAEGGDMDYQLERFFGHDLPCRFGHYNRLEDLINYKNELAAGDASS
jgi:hypothetical protein